MLSICFLADKMSVPPSTIFREWSEEDKAFMIAYYMFKAEEQEKGAKT
jgi:hypothetical protein